MVATPSSQLTGALIDGRYRIDRVVGEGGFGTVYAAWHLGLGSHVAFKVLKVPTGPSREELARLCGAFLDEARLLARLRHPNIVAALDTGLLPADADGVALPFLVMEWCSGPPLDAFLRDRRGKPFSVASAWELFEPIAEAIAHAHAAGVAHRDIKPANILFEGSVPRVADFGIAKLVLPDATPGGATTNTAGYSPFTPRYAAPEQLASTRTGPWTDVHALALLFVELVIGRSAVDPSDGDGLAMLDPARPTPKRHGVDVGALEPVLEKALALRPGDRYPNAAALCEAMRAALRGSAGIEPTVSRPEALVVAPAFPERTAPPSSRTLREPTARRGPRTTRVLLSSAVGLALTAGAASGVWFAIRPARQHAPALSPRTKESGATDPVAAPTASSVARRRLKDIPADELKTRMDSADLGTCMKPSLVPGGYVIACTQALVVGGDHPERDEHDFADIVGLEAAPSVAATFGAAEVAIEDHFVVAIGTSKERLPHAVEVMLKDVAADRVWEPTAPARSADARSSLAAWTSLDLYAAASAQGKIYSASLRSPIASISVEAGGSFAAITLLVEKPEEFELMRSPTWPCRYPCVWAQDADRVLVVSEALASPPTEPKVATEAFVQRLLDGAHAQRIVHVAR